MRIKHLILSSGLALSLLSSSIVGANPVTDPVNPIQKQHHYHKGNWKMLTPEERQQMHALLQDMRQQLKPLIKEKRALKLQLMGKLATPGTQWDDVASLVNSINENNAKIRTLFTKTQLKGFQITGMLLPLQHGKQHHQGKLFHR